MLGIGLFASMLGIAWPSVRASFGLPLDALGLLLLASTASHLLASFATGRLVSALGVGRFLLLSSLVMMAGAAAFSRATSWGWLIVASMVAGAGMGAMDGALNIYFALNFSTRLVNWLHVNFGLGAMLGPVFVTTLLARALPWQSGYLVVSGVFAALAVCFLITRRRWQLPTDTMEEARPSAPLRQTLRLPLAWAGIFLFFVYTGVESVAGQWSYTLLTEGRGVLPAYAGIWLSLFWAGLGVGRFLFGLIGDRWSATRLLLGCMAIALLGSLLIAIPTWPGLNFGGLALMGLALAPIFPTLIAMTPRWVGHTHAANSIGFQVSAASLGYAVLPAIAGILAARISLEAIGPFLAANTLLMLWFYRRQLTHPLVQSPAA